MKRYSFNEFLLRVTSVIAETTAAYLVYLFFQQWLHLPDIALPYLVLAGVTGMLISGLNIKGLRQDAMAGIITAIGILLILSLCVNIVIGHDHNRVEGIFFMAVFLLFIWSRGVKGYNCDYLEIYQISTFYFYIGYFVFINFMVFVVGFMNVIAAEIARYTILYIILALFMLFQMKSEKYLKKTKAEKKLSFDLVLTIGIIIVTLLLSTPKATAILAIPFAFIYRLLSKFMLVIAIPTAFAMQYLASLFHINFADIFKNNVKNMQENGYKSKVNFDDQYYNPQLIDNMVRFLTITVLIIATIIIIRMIIKYMQKVNKRKINDEFTEEKEFVTGMNLGKLTQSLKNAGSKLSDAVGRAVFRLSADNREKLRFEYGMFVGKVYGKKIIERENHTAQDIMELLREKYPESGESLDKITQMYENVRYGTAQPQNEELRDFKKNIGNVLKAL